MIFVKFGHSVVQAAQYSPARSCPLLLKEGPALCIVAVVETTIEK